MVWLAANRAGLVRKQVMPLDTCVWGECVYTTQLAMWKEEDMLWLERGKFQRFVWWDSECDQAQQLVRTCEKIYHRYQHRLVNTVCGGRGNSFECQSKLECSKHEYRDALHKYRLILRQKERCVRTGRRDKLLRDRYSRGFWRDVAKLDLNHLQSQLSNNTTSVSLDIFAQHFESIANPPHCDWFNDEFHTHIKSVINCILKDLDSDHIMPPPCPPENPYHAHLRSMPNVTAIKRAAEALNANITIDELRLTKERMNKGKAAGVDGLYMEYFLGERIDEGEGDERQLISPLDGMILNVFNKILTTGRFPELWRMAALMPLLKGGAESQ